MDLLRTQDNSQVSFNNRDTSGGVSPPLQGTPGFMTDGDPATPTQATQIPGYHYDVMMGEIYNAVIAAGITPDDTNYTQLYQAILSLSRIHDTGAVNALAGAPRGALLTNLPALSAFPDGFTIEVTPVATNTIPAPTFAWNGGSPVTITDPFSQPLLSGDIAAGKPARLRKEGGDWWLMNVPPRVQAGPAVRLSASLAAAGNSVTFTADSIGVAGALGGAGNTIANFNKTLNIGTVGAGGMDSGSPPISGFVAIYAIYGQNAGQANIMATTVSQTTVYEGASMPAGYNMSALIAIWPTNASGQLVPGAQIDRGFYLPLLTLASQTVLSNGTATSATAVSLAGIVPAAARVAYVNVALIDTGSITGNSATQVGPTSAVNYLFVGVSVSNAQLEQQALMPMVTAQQLYYQNAKTGLQTTIQVVGYQI